MYNEFQYQVTAKPISFSSGLNEVITPDKWLPVFPDKLPRPQITFAQTVFPFGYNLATAAPLITFPQYPNQFFPPKPLQQYIGYFAYDFGIAIKETITLDKWKPNYIDRFPRPPITPSISIFIPVFTSSETIQMSKWYVPIVQQTVRPPVLSFEHTTSVYYPFEPSVSHPFFTPTSPMGYLH